MILLFVAGSARAQKADVQFQATPLLLQTGETFTARDGLPHNTIRSLCVRNDAVWVGTDAGLALLAQGRCTSWTRFDDDPNARCPPISAIDVDPQTMDVWLGTWGQGIIRKTAERFDRFDQFNSGLAGDLVFDLVFAAGRVWAATNGGISALDPATGEWDVYLQRRAERFETAATSLHVDPTGRFLHAGIWCAGLQRIRIEPDAARVVVPGSIGGLDTPAFQDSESATPTAHAVGPTGGTLWCATRSCVFRRGLDDKWDARSLPDGERPDAWPRCLAVRSDTEAWLGTEDGLRILADWPTDTWISVRRHRTESQTTVVVHRGGRLVNTRSMRPAIPDNRILCVAFRGAEAWIGTAGGLTRIVVRETPRNPLEVAGDPDRVVSGPVATSVTPSRPAADPAVPTVAEEHAGAVAIGILTPVNRTVFLPGQHAQPVDELRRLDPAAVHLAIRQANTRGGYRGRSPFEALVADYGYARYGWNLPEDDLITLALQENVMGLVAFVDPGRHFTAAAVSRTGVPLIYPTARPGCPDCRPMPWMFPCRSDDSRRQKELLDYLFEQIGRTKVALVRTPNRTSQQHLDRWAHLARDAGHPPLADVFYNPQIDDLGDVLEAIQRAQADVLLTWCEDKLAAAILKQMRGAGMSHLFVGGPGIVTTRFASLSEGEFGPVIALWGCPGQTDRDAEKRFASDYRATFDRPPGPMSFRCYLAAEHLLRAIDLAGLDRFAVRRTLAEMDLALLARLEGGSWTFESPSHGSGRSVSGL